MLLFSKVPNTLQPVLKWKLSQVSSSRPPTSQCPLRCVGVVLLLYTSMLALMRPAAQTLNRSARRLHFLDARCYISCWNTHFCFNTDTHLAQEDSFSSPASFTHCLTSLPCCVSTSFIFIVLLAVATSLHTSALIFSLHLYSGSFSLDTAGGDCTFVIADLSSTPEWL